jgi:DNA polymerase-3 subunit alpha
MSLEAVSHKKHAGFVHLRVRSIYSLLEGAIRPKELAETARRLRMPAVAVTDTNNLFGAYEISAALAQQGIQPITGVTLAVALPDDLSTPVRHAQGEHSYPSVALLVKDADGYVQLSKLISSAYTEVAPEEAPHATLDRCLRRGNQRPRNACLAA